MYQITIAQSIYSDRFGQLDHITTKENNYDDSDNGEVGNTNLMNDHDDNDNNKKNF